MTPLSYAMGPERYRAWRASVRRRVLYARMLHRLTLSATAFGVAMIPVARKAIEAFEEFQRASRRLADALRGPE